MRQILIADLQTAVPLQSAELKRLARTVLAGEKLGSGSLSIAFVNRRMMRKVNLQFLNHDFDTDVLAFPLGGDMIGELVISTDYARKEAKSRGLPVAEELSRYVVHGLLHLAGYDDHKPADKKRMWKKQEAYLKLQSSKASKR